VATTRACRIGPGIRIGIPHCKKACQKDRLRAYRAAALDPVGASPQASGMSDPSISFVTVNGCRIRLMRAGKGAPLVFLHGASGASWLPLLENLSRNFDVIAPEHPGFGESETPDWLDTIHDLAFFYLDFMDALNLREVHLVGTSFGGWIAAELAVRNTQHLASLTLVSAGGLRVPGVAQMDTFLGSEEERLRAFFYDPKRADALIARVLSPEFEDIALKNRATMAKLAWQPRDHDPLLPKWLHRIDVPTLLIWGDHDRLFPEAHAFTYQGLIPGAKLVMFSECGHVPHIEKADECLTGIESFLGAEAAAA
jgi:pimeloyl-ACP methyl ester carboxylesterase